MLVHRRLTPSLGVGGGYLSVWLSFGWVCATSTRFRKNLRSKWYPVLVIGQFWISCSVNFVNFNSPLFWRVTFLIRLTYTSDATMLLLHKSATLLLQFQTEDKAVFFYANSQILRSRSWVPISRPRWAAYTRIGVMGEYPPGLPPALNSPVPIYTTRWGEALWESSDLPKLPSSFIYS